MNIQLFEPHLAGSGGIFSYLYRSLISCKGAKAVETERPLPRITSPREHSSAWGRFDGHEVFFDMSDHAFFFDADALRRCDVYFKANLNRDVMRKALPETGREPAASKVVPLLLFAGHLEYYRRDSLYNRLYGLTAGTRHDLCHIVGVYENPVAKGEESIFQGPEDNYDPARYHFWIRYHVQKVLREAGISGYYRLTSRWMEELEDGRLVFPSLSQRAFKRRMLASRMTVVNILPHALLPWKAGESLALGKPILIERAPLVEIPEPYTIREGEHFLELLPGFGSFDEAAPLEDPGSYRILDHLDLELLGMRAREIKAALGDRERMAHMAECSLRYSREVLQPAVLADYIVENVRRRIH